MARAARSVLVGRPISANDVLPEERGSTWSSYARHGSLGEPQTEGDPVLGEHQLLHNGYLSFGIPYLLWPLVRPWMGGFAGEETLPWRDGDNADMP